MMPNMLRLTLICFTLAVAVAGSALAQPSLDIQGNRIAIGADRTAVLKSLTLYRVDCLGEEGKSITECNSLLVQSSREVYSPIANVYFQGGKVKSLRKYWDRGFEGTNPGPLVQTLFSVVTQLTKETGVAPTVTTLERRDPGTTQQSIVLTAGRRKVTINHAEGLRGNDGNAIPTFVNVFETAE
jgi:hypothetical protein